MKSETSLFFAYYAERSCIFFPFVLLAWTKRTKNSSPGECSAAGTANAHEESKTSRMNYFPKITAGGTRFAILNDPESAVFPAKLQLSTEIIQTGREQGADRVFYFQEKIQIAPQQKN